MRSENTVYEWWAVIAGRIGHNYAISLLKIRFILTHPDMDHMDGIEVFFDEFRPINLWDTNNRKEIEEDSWEGSPYSESDWDFYKNLRDNKPESNPKRLTLYSGSQGKYYNVCENGSGGGDGLFILAPTKELLDQANELDDDYNCCSYVILYRTGEHKIVFGGDSHDDSWKHILNAHADSVKDIDILIAPHHGRKSGLSYDFLDVLWPKVTYITALKRSEMMRLVEDSKHPLQPSLFDRKNLAEVQFGGRRYILCHNPLKKDQDTALRKRLLTKTEEKLEAIAKAVASGRLKKKDKIAKRLYSWINRWNCERFFEVDYDEGRFEFHRNQSEIERYAQLDGCYVIVTSIGDQMDATEVQGRYKSLSYVEKAFRQMKTTDLFVRPIRHWTEERVRGHVFMCMFAYLVIWEARCQLEPVLERDPVTHGCEAGSLREIWEELDNIQLATINIAGLILKQLRPITSYQQKLLDLLNAKLGKAARIRLEIAA